MSLFNINLFEIMTFFAVLIRYSILFAVLPFFGDRVIPVPVKLLTSLMVSTILFPVLVSTGNIHPNEARIWAASTTGIASTVASEAIFGLVLGYVGKVAFDCIGMGANLVGNFMGFASASYFDPHQEAQTEVIAQLQNVLAMLIFIAIDGHHMMLRASLDSYRIVGLGKATFGSPLNQHLVQLSGDVIRYGLQIAAPVAIALFSVNIALGMLAKAIPQLNIFALSFSVTAFVGFVVMLFGLPEFQDVTVGIFGRSKEWMGVAMQSMAAGR